jgi:hypothetical protein
LTTAARHLACHAPTDEDRAGFANRLGELLEGAIGPSARRLVHAVPVRTELLKP